MKRAYKCDENSVGIVIYSVQCIKYTEKTGE